MQNLMVSYHAPDLPDTWAFTPFKSTTDMEEYYKKHNLDMYIDCYVLEWDEELEDWVHVDGKGNRRLCDAKTPDEALRAAGWIIDAIVAGVIRSMG